VRAIDAQTGEQVLFQGAHNDWVLGTAFSSDASHLVSVSRDRSMKLIQVETEQFIDNITSITPGALKGGLITVDRHPGQEFMLVGGADGVPKIMRIYREKDRKIGDDFNLVKQFQPLEGRIFSAEFNHDGSRFVAGSSHERSGEVRVYDSESQSGEPLWSLRVEGPVYAVAFSPDGGTVAAAGFDGNVRLIDAAGGAVRRAFVPVPLAARAF
jgi:WD40 repeat protein